MSLWVVFADYAGVLVAYGWRGESVDIPISSSRLLHLQRGDRGQRLLSCILTKMGKPSRQTLCDFGVLFTKNRQKIQFTWPADIVVQKYKFEQILMLALLILFYLTVFTDANTFVGSESGID